VIWALYLAVFVTDALIGFWAGRYFDARQAKRYGLALWYSGLLDLAIGVNAMGFVEAKWPMLIPSLLGGLLGTYWSMQRERMASE
jgi:hypothetical protein